VCEKWRLASDKQGSGNTANIGSITFIRDILADNSLFARLEEEWFDEYWMNSGVTTPIKSNARVTRSALALHSQRRAFKKEIPMEKIDYKKQLKHLYAPSAKKVEVVEVPQMNFLMVDGEGDPNTSKAFSDAIEALYSLSYTLKFMVKEKMSVDYGVLPLEAIWWADDMSAFSTGNKDAWKWTAMIMQPEFITPSMVEEATEAVRRKKNPVSLPLVRFEAFQEGRAAQILHVGPFSEEGPTIEKVHSFIESNANRRTGKHHEIYLTDLRRAAPEKWKTVVRQPMSE
jgi:hypothetical protein